MQNIVNGIQRCLIFTLKIKPKLLTFYVQRYIRARNSMNADNNINSNKYRYYIYVSIRVLATLIATGMLILTNSLTQTHSYIVDTFGY